MLERLVKQNLFFINNKNCANNWLSVKLWTITSFFFFFCFVPNVFQLCSQCLSFCFWISFHNCSQLFQWWSVSCWWSRSPEAILLVSSFLTNDAWSVWNLISICQTLLMLQMTLEHNDMKIASSLFWCLKVIKKKNFKQLLKEMLNFKMIYRWTYKLKGMMWKNNPTSELWNDPIYSNLICWYWSIMHHIIAEWISFFLVSFNVIAIFLI